jgi:preprotein translocase subunit SecD
MYEKPGRYVVLTLALIVGAFLSMFLPERPFRLGLDLRGGTRLVYNFDFERALDLGQITQAEFDDREQLLRDTADIIRNRVDPDGLLEASFRPEGEERLVIELPGDAMARTGGTAELVAAITAQGTTLELSAPEEELKKFPVTGGVIGIGPEKIRYDQRDGNMLLGLARSREGVHTDHAAGESVRLLSDDAVRILIENTGDMQFYIGARDTDLRSKGTDLTTERKKLDDWIAAHPEQKIADFNALTRPWHRCSKSSKESCRPLSPSMSNRPWRSSRAPRATRPSVSTSRRSPEPGPSAGS